VVDPEATVRIMISYISHSAAEQIIRVLPPMTDGKTDATCKQDMHYDHRWTISFPLSKLDSVKRGLDLSAAVDLKSHGPRLIARC